MSLGQASLGGAAALFAAAMAPCGLLAQTPPPQRNHGNMAAGQQCAMCHVSHPGGRQSYVLRGAGTGPSADAWLEVQAPGTGAVTATCLRCHWNPETRRRQPDFSLIGAPAASAGQAGGLHVGPDLTNDHPLGSLDAPRRMRPFGLWREDDGRPAAAQPFEDLTSMECTLCHDPHDPAAGIPRGVEQVQLCGSCHPDQSGHLAEHSGIECTGCHRMHNVQQGRLLHETTNEALCGRCHADASGVLPSLDLRGTEVGARPAVTRTHNPGSRCDQCHAIHR